MAFQNKISLTIGLLCCVLLCGCEDTQPEIKTVKEVPADERVSSEPYGGEVVFEETETQTQALAPALCKVYNDTALEPYECEDEQLADFVRDFAADIKEKYSPESSEGYNPGIKGYYLKVCVPDGDGNEIVVYAWSRKHDVLDIDKSLYTVSLDDVEMFYDTVYGRLDELKGAE